MGIVISLEDNGEDIQTLTVVEESKDEAPSPEEAMEEVDTNGDGYMDMDEFQEAWDANEDGEIDASTLFDDCDVDDNELIDIEEMGCFIDGIVEMMSDDDDGDHEEGEPCDDGSATIKLMSTDSWHIESVSSELYDFVQDGDDYAAFKECAESGPDDLVVTYKRVVKDDDGGETGETGGQDNETSTNLGPSCEVYWFGEGDDLTEGTAGGNAATVGSENGTFDVDLVEGEKYSLMFYCVDPEGDDITVNIDAPIGDDKSFTGSGTLSGYYEFTIPAGTSVIGEMEVGFDWTDGTNSGEGTVNVDVAPPTDSGDGGESKDDDDSAAEDVSAGNFVPGFTGVLAMTALAGAFLVFSRREE